MSLIFYSSPSESYFINSLSCKYEREVAKICTYEMKAKSRGVGTCLNRSNRPETDIGESENQIENFKTRRTIYDSFGRPTDLQTCSSAERIAPGFLCLFADITERTEAWRCLYTYADIILRAKFSVIASEQANLCSANRCHYRSYCSYKDKFC